MKLRSILALLMLLAAAALVAAGCGSDDENGDEEDGASAVACDDQEGLDAIEDEGERIRRNKECSVENAVDTFESDETIDNCVNLGRAYMALASPESTGDPDTPAEQPEDRDESLASAVETYEKCLDLDADNVDVQRSLASTYMATSAYDKAAPLLEQVARSEKNNANAWYAWGLAASNSGDTAGTKRAWANFLKFAEDDDPRVQQVEASIKVINETGSTGAQAGNGGGNGGGGDEDADDEG